MNRDLGLARKEDLKDIALIYVEEFSKPPYDEVWTLDKAIAKMKFYLEFYDLYCVKVEGNVAGFAVVNSNFMCPGEVAFLEEFAVREDSQGKGLGTWVLKEFFGMYEEKGFLRFMCIVNRESRAYGLYERLGVLPSEDDVLIEKVFE